MTRRTAEERHRIEQDVSTELMDVLVALHHPTRRWLAELLWVEGPATVGRLAARTGLAVGSVSHHLKPLHQQGFIEPAPELARDTRESWWRTTPRNLSWSVEDFEPDSLGRRVADQAEVENFRYQVRAIQRGSRRWTTPRPSGDARPGRPTAWSRPRPSRRPTCTAAWTPSSRRGPRSPGTTSSERPDVVPPCGPDRDPLLPQQPGAPVTTTLIGAPPPPVRRDPMVLTWLVGVAVSAFGDAVWIVALAWTAAHTLVPGDGRRGHRHRDAPAGRARPRRWRDRRPLGPRAAC